MDDRNKENSMAPKRKRRGGGRNARQEARKKPVSKVSPYLQRKIPYYEILSEEGLQLIEGNADTVLEEIGVDFKEDPEALELWKGAGADVKGERVRFPKGLCRSLIQKTAPVEYTQYARNPEKNVQIGRKNGVLVPGYGAPFIRNLEEGRRYATIKDFENFVKLTYMSPGLHHSGGTLCEPVDLPVNKRHFDMIYSHIKYSDKPFMGSVTSADRAQDTVDMAKIVFGEEFVGENTVLTSLINVNSPLAFDSTMLGAAKVYARNNQACVVSPFILSGAMSPVTVAGTAAQILAEALAGLAFTQLVRPGAPAIFGTFSSSVSMQSGAPTFGTPESSQVIYITASLARRLGVPFRSGGSLAASKVVDSQAAYESASSLKPAILAGVNFLLHAAGWLEGGLVMGYEKFVLDADQAAMMQRFIQGVDLSENGQALDAIREVGPGNHYLGCAHTQANFETAFYHSPLADNNSFEQWEQEGCLTAEQRANKLWKKMLEEYQAPHLDPAIDEALLEFMQKRKSSFSDASV